MAKAYEQRVVPYPIEVGETQGRSWKAEMGESPSLDHIGMHTVHTTRVHRLGLTRVDVGQSEPKAGNTSCYSELSRMPNPPHSLDVSNSMAGRTCHENLLGGVPLQRL